MESLLPCSTFCSLGAFWYSKIDAFNGVSPNTPRLCLHSHITIFRKQMAPYIQHYYGTDLLNTVTGTNTPSQKTHAAGKRDWCAHWICFAYKLCCILESYNKKLSINICLGRFCRLSVQLIISINKHPPTVPGSHIKYIFRFLFFIPHSTGAASHNYLSIFFGNMGRKFAHFRKYHVDRLLIIRHNLLLELYRQKNIKVARQQSSPLENVFMIAVSIQIRHRPKTSDPGRVRETKQVPCWRGFLDLATPLNLIVQNLFWHTVWWYVLDCLKKREQMIFSAAL